MAKKTTVITEPGLSWLNDFATNKKVLSGNNSQWSAARDDKQ